MNTRTFVRARNELRRPPAKLHDHTLGGVDVGPEVVDVTERSPALLEIAQYIADLQGLVRSALGDLEEFAAVAPEIETRYRRILRIPDGAGWLVDRVLELVPVDEQTFAVTYYLGDAGFEIPNGAAIMTGELVFDGADRQNFYLTIDFDAAASVAPELESAGQITIQSRALDGGGQEIWCDLREVRESAEKEPESSFTTYRVDGRGHGELEYVVNQVTEVTRVSASWDDNGGRSTNEVDRCVDGGPVRYTTTRCWNAAGLETSTTFSFTRNPEVEQRAASSWAEGSGLHRTEEWQPVDESPTIEWSPLEAAETSMWSPLDAAETSMWSPLDAAETSMWIPPTYECA
jgi:hypothetical protein